MRTLSHAGHDGYGTFISPGNSRKVNTVGSMTSWGDANAANDIVSTYSARGPTRIDRFVKPDLVGPGNRVISLKAKGAYLYKNELVDDKTRFASPQEQSIQPKQSSMGLLRNNMGNLRRYNPRGDTRRSTLESQVADPPVMLQR